jgi:ribosomal protein S18 acetylase RimI-like enzyme
MIAGDSTIRIEDAADAKRIELVAQLFRSYADEFAGLLAETLCLQGFAAEVAGLPGRYGPPTGCLLLAMDGRIPAGCVGLRDLGNGTCEMKRLYVTPPYRGRGTGRLLVKSVIHRGGSMGYRRMVLDTLPEMAAAIALYREFGFIDSVPNWSHPVEQAVFLEKPLNIDGLR